MVKTDFLQKIIKIYLDSVGIQSKIDTIEDVLATIYAHDISMICASKILNNIYDALKNTELMPFYQNDLNDAMTYVSDKMNPYQHTKLDIKKILADFKIMESALHFDYMCDVISQMDKMDTELYFPFLLGQIIDLLNHNHIQKQDILYFWDELKKFGNAKILQQFLTDIYDTDIMAYKVTDLTDIFTRSSPLHDDIVADWQIFKQKHIVN